MNFDYKRLIKFEHNVGNKEKTIRMGVGAVIILVSLFLANILLLLIGLILVTTGYAGWCPAYSGFDRNTCEKNEASATATKTEEVTK